MRRKGSIGLLAAGVAPALFVLGCGDGVGAEACESTDVCDSGTAEICTDQTGIQLNFTA